MFSRWISCYNGRAMKRVVKNIIQRFLPYQLMVRIERRYHWLQAVVSSLRYGRPARRMRVIGVTGTNGKTTTSFMIHRMLVESGLNVGLMTTVGYGVNNDINPQIEHMTTASAPILNKRLSAMKKAGVEWLVLEVTSHALAQYRTWGVPYEIAVMTNVTHEHLDYHGTFEDYKKSKLRLFQLANRHPQGFSVVNYDDESVADFLKGARASESYGLHGGQLVAHEVSLTGDGSRYIATAQGEKYEIACHIPGEFNIYNSLAAVAVGRRVGLTNQQIERGIAALKTVEGRMVSLREGQDFTVIIDFAHTPDAFERLLSDLRLQTKGKLVAVFGSAGRRDESKRSIQGEIAGRYCEEVILTEEDNRDIDGGEILEQIAAGAIRSGKNKDENLFLIPDRTEAIIFAMTRVHNDRDTVVLLGKGHEKTIERADGEHPWDEVATARSAIRSTLRGDIIE